MTMKDSNIPYFLKVTWIDNGKPQEKVCDHKTASTLLYELERRKGIKGKLEFLE